MIEIVWRRTVQIDQCEPLCNFCPVDARSASHRPAQMWESSFSLSAEKLRFWFFFFYVYECLYIRVYTMYVYMCAWCPWRSEESVPSSRSGYAFTVCLLRTEPRFSAGSSGVPNHWANTTAAPPLLKPVSHQGCCLAYLKIPGINAYSLRVCVLSLCLEGNNLWLTLRMGT